MQRIYQIYSQDQQLLPLVKMQLCLQEFLSKFAKDNENLKLIGGMMENEILDQAGVTKCSKFTNIR